MSMTQMYDSLSTTTSNVDRSKFIYTSKFGERVKGMDNNQA